LKIDSKGLQNNRPATAKAISKGNNMISQRLQSDCKAIQCLGAFCAAITRPFRTGNKAIAKRLRSHRKAISKELQSDFKVTAKQL
jgi:hypothetical protein